MYGKNFQQKKFQIKQTDKIKLRENKVLSKNIMAKKKQQNRNFVKKKFQQTKL